MKRWQPWVLLVLVFVAGFTGGVVATRATVRHFVQRALKDPNLMRERVERRIDRKLALNPDQRAIAHEALLKAQADLRTLRTEFQPRFQAIIERAATQIDATLARDQQRKFQHLREQNGAWWQGP